MSERTKQHPPAPNDTPTAAGHEDMPQAGTA
jgi:hypothetical protein